MSKGVIFDFDGVIINSSEVQKQALMESYKTVVGGCDLPSFEEFLSHSGDSLSNIFQKMNLPLSMIEPYRNISRSKVELIRVYDGIKELIVKLRDQRFKCALCTGKDRDRTNELLEKLGMLELFDSVVCSDDVCNPKPFPDSLILAVSNIGVSPKNVVMVGDAKNDIVCAKNAGIANIAVMWGDVPKEVLEKELPDYIVNTIDELYDAINECLSDSVIAEENSNMNSICCLADSSQLLTDYLRSEMKSFKVDKVLFCPDKKIIESFRKISLESSSTLYMVLLAVYNIFLSKYSTDEDIVVGIPASKLQKVDIQNAVDATANMLVVRSKLKGSLEFNKFLKNVNSNVFKAKEEPAQNYNIAKFDLTLSAIVKDDGLSFELMYPVSLYKKSTIIRFAKYYLNILKQIVEDQNIKLADIEVVCSEEKKQLLYDFNNTYSKYPRNKTIHELFEEQVMKTPDNVALEYDGKELTYRELNEKSNQLARALRERDIAVGCMVGIMVRHSFEIIIGIMAILKAGGAYVPIDPEYPGERIKYVLSDTGIKVLLTQSDLKHDIEFTGKIITLDDQTLFEGDVSNLSILNSSNDLSYIIYTSGSTGNPKGVMVTHQGLVNYIIWAQKVYISGEKLDFPLYSSISFDLTITSIFTPLLTGNRVVIYNQTFKAFLLRNIILEGKVGIIKLTPTHLMLLDVFDIKKTQVRKIIVGGEDLKTELARNIYEKFNKNIEIFNEYGPTETVVGCMIHKYNPISDIRSSVPIGIPADNTRIYLLDKHLKLVPQGAVGEIYISGDGVAKGYLNQPGLTEERFIPDPYNPSSKMYKTGDLARWLEDGNIEFIGRIDNQVKVKGFRIELGEIEAKLLLHPYIKEVVVLARDNWDNNKYLCAYYVANQEISISQLRLYLSNKLPDYMIPSYFIPINNMPLNQNGKLDKKALPEP